MIYNLLKKQNIVRKIHGASDVQLLAHSSKLVFVETFIGFVLAICLSHMVFFEWQKRYSIKVPLWLGSYIPLAAFLFISLSAFVFYFLVRLRKIKYADAL